MEIKIVNNAKEVYGQNVGRYGSYNQEWANQMKAISGKWLKVETDSLFDDQFNTEDYRIMQNMVQEIKDDARVGRGRCGWCGNHAPVDKPCHEAKYFQAFKIPPVLGYVEEVDEYILQAEKFLKDTDTEMTVTFLKNDRHFADDTEYRDIYKIIFKRGKVAEIIKFGQSISNSQHNHRIEPNAYDVLTCLTKHMPENSLEDFAAAFGYEIDEPKDRQKAARVYKGAKKEWGQVNRLWGDDEATMEQLQEIQ